MPKVFSVDVREIVLQVREYFLQEKQFDGPLIPFEKVHERVAAATGISLHSVSNIVREGKLGKITTPSKKKSKKQKVAEINFVEGVLRNKIHEYYMMKKSKPTIRQLLHMLTTEIDFKGSQEILQQHIQKLGYGFKRGKGKVVFVPLEILALQNDQDDDQNEDTESYPIDYLEDALEESGLTLDRCKKLNQTDAETNKRKQPEGVPRLVRKTFNAVRSDGTKFRAFIVNDPLEANAKFRTLIVKKTKMDRQLKDSLNKIRSERNKHKINVKVEYNDKEDENNVNESNVNENNTNESNINGQFLINTMPVDFIRSEHDYTKI